MQMYGVLVAWFTLVPGPGVVGRGTKPISCEPVAPSVGDTPVPGQGPCVTLGPGCGHRSSAVRHLGMVGMSDKQRVAGGNGARWRGDGSACRIRCFFLQDGKIVCDM